MSGGEALGGDPTHKELCVCAEPSYSSRSSAQPLGTHRHPLKLKDFLQHQHIQLRSCVHRVLLSVYP